MKTNFILKLTGILLLNHFFLQSLEAKAYQPANSPIFNCTVHGDGNQDYTLESKSNGYSQYQSGGSDQYIDIEFLTKQGLHFRMGTEPVWSDGYWLEVSYGILQIDEDAKRECINDGSYYSMAGWVPRNIVCWNSDKIKEKNHGFHKLGPVGPVTLPELRTSYNTVSFPQGTLFLDSYKIKNTEIAVTCGPK